VCGGQQEVGNECERDSKKWGRSVKGTAGRGQECERVSRKCGRSVKGSAGSGSGAKGVQEEGVEEYEWVKWK